MPGDASASWYLDVLSLETIVMDCQAGNFKVMQCIIGPVETVVLCPLSHFPHC